MQNNDRIEALLLNKKVELTERLDRITANVRRKLDADSKEQAKQLEDQEVVDALGNEAREELAKISAALTRLEEGTFGACANCGNGIPEARLEAYPYAQECITCATVHENEVGIS